LKEKAIFNWSGGKDSALCLHKILQAQQYEVLCLLTTINKQNQRVSMHGVRNGLLLQQTESIGIPLIQVPLSEISSMEDYEKAMMTTLKDLTAKGGKVSIYGDIFLEDVRAYREKKLSALNIRGLFPLWGIKTDKLIREFIDSGYKAIVTCTDDRYLDKSFAGRLIDHDFLHDLPRSVDPCGENGEFHSFVYDGLIFKKPIFFRKGTITYRKYPREEPENDAIADGETNTKDAGSAADHGFWYCDLLPETAG